MTRFYTNWRKPHGLYRWIVLLVCFAVLNVTHIPASLAQLNNHKYSGYSESTLPPLRSSSLVSGAFHGLPLKMFQSLSRLPVYTLSSEPILLMPFFGDSTKEQSASQSNPYLLEDKSAEQTITLQLPKVDVGKVMIAVYSPSGSLLMKKSVRSREESNMEMDLTDLQAGAYFLEIQAAEIYEKFSFMLE